MNNYLDHVDRLVKGARAKLHDAPHCGIPPGGGLDLPEGVRVAGWSLMLGIFRHDDVGHWHLSAMLWPKNRSSAMDDWHMLGRLLQCVVGHSDYPDDAPEIEPLTPFKSTPPSAVHRWAWHADGSRLDPAAEAMLKKVLGKISATRLPLTWLSAVVRIQREGNARAAAEFLDDVATWWELRAMFARARKNPARIIPRRAGA